MRPTDDLDTLLRRARQEDLDRRAERLAELLDEAELLHRHRALRLPADLRRHLDARAVTVAEELTTLLVQWRVAGGELALELPEEEVVVDAAPTEAAPGPAAPGPAAPIGTAPFDTAPVEEPADELDDEPGLDPTEEVERPGPAERSDDGAAPPQGGDGAPAGTAAPPPPAPPASAPTPSAPPATLDALARLSDHFHSGTAHIPDVPTESYQDRLEDLLAELYPRDDDDAELAAIEAAARRTEEWLRFPRSTQQALIGLLATRLRVLQDERHVTGSRVDACFSSLTRFSKLHEPGFVFGLARDHRPERGTWTRDAEHWWDQLTDLLPAEESKAPNRGRLLHDLQNLMDELAIAPEQARSAVRQQAVNKVREIITSSVRSNDPGLVRLAAPLLDDLRGREFRTLRRAIRKARAVAEDTDDDGGTTALDSSWPWWPLTAGKRAVMVGGDPREPNRARIQRRFGFAELTWLDAPDKPRALEALRDSIRRRGVDLVIILGGFIGHNYDDVLLPACREADVPFAHVDHGYGMKRIRLAIERYVPAPGTSRQEAAN